MRALLTQLSWPELRHHPWRSGAALLAVMLGVALAFSVQLINQSALSEFSSAVRSVNGDPDFELRAQRSGFDEALYERVATHPQVALASPVVDVETQAVSAQGQRVSLRVLGLDALVAAPLSPALLPRTEKGADRFALFDPQTVFLNAAARQKLGDAGTLRVQTPTGMVTLRVQGNVAAGGSALAVMDIAGAQANFGWLGKLSRIDVRLQPGADRDQVLKELALPDGVRAALPDEAAQKVSNLSRAYRVNLTVLALVAMFTGAFLVFSILSLSVAKRQPQLALLGVLGMTAQQRLRLVLTESALLGLVGSVLGLALGTALAATALRLLSGDLGGGYFPGVTPTLQFSFLSALVYGGLGVLAAVVGGYMPARAAQHLAPAQALKGLGDSTPTTAFAWLGPSMLVVSVLLAFMPPMFDLPLAAYVSVALLLLGGIACVPSGVGLLLRWLQPPSNPLALLAVEA
jgi:putative ABC transport system permease protein